MALEEQITDAIAAHMAWKVRLARAIAYGSSDFVVEVVRQDDQCPFGKWLYEIDPVQRRSPDHELVRTFHADFHVAAAAVLDLAVAGKRRAAEAAMEPGSEFARTSMELMLALVAWQRA